MSPLTTAFVAGAAGARHRTTFQPPQPPRATVVAVPPLAEEAAKSRRMFALLGRRLNDSAIALQITDAHGCGDSVGDFAEARWSTWRQDLVGDIREAAGEDGAPVVVLGVRLGALLVRDALAELATPVDLVFWQPTVSGKQALAQFLRLRTTAAMLNGERERVGDLEARLDDGETLEVGGYALHPELAAAIRAARLAVPTGTAGHAWWYWLTANETVPPPVAEAAADWSAAGWSVEPETLGDDAFWASQEIATAPALVERTAVAIEGTLA